GEFIELTCSCCPFAFIFHYLDDGSSPQIYLQRPFVYFGQLYNQIYVNNNGHLTFTSSWSSYAPVRFPNNGTKDLIAALWTDLDNRQYGQVYHKQYTSGTVLLQATQDINDYFPGIDFNASWVFVATWYEVAYYPNSGTVSQVNSVLDNICFFTVNTLQNCNPFFHSYLQAGYDTINSTFYFSIPGSFSSSATGANSIFHLSSNVNVTGRWAFRSDHGSRVCTYNGNCIHPFAQLLNSLFYLLSA
uniref:NIDO domain-containing protein n=1 Tax=Mola mola TaxID=94237 RepID=A0A3Q3VYU5_MOLML